MRAVVSRVSTAAVSVAGAVVGEIGPGLLSLVGVGRTDDEAAARALARKIHQLRIFPGEDGERSAADLGLPILVVSQFTLYADTRKGRRPSWQDAAAGRRRSRWWKPWSTSCAAAAARSLAASSEPACRSAP